jgi:protein-tyrosine phosphatase
VYKSFVFRLEITQATTLHSISKKLVISLVGNRLKNMEIITSVDKVENANGKVLIHCGEGVSRSVTICLAYLIKCKKIALKDAFLQVKRVRSQANPNNGKTF